MAEHDQVFARYPQQVQDRRHEIHLASYSIYRFMYA